MKLLIGRPYSPPVEMLCPHCAMGMDLLTRHKSRKMFTEIWWCSVDGSAVKVEFPSMTPVPQQNDERDKGTVLIPYRLTEMKK